LAADAYDATKFNALGGGEALDTSVLTSPFRLCIKSRRPQW